jgi:hypothetical protein
MQQQKKVAKLQLPLQLRLRTFVRDKFQRIFVFIMPFTVEILY